MKLYSLIKQDNNRKKKRVGRGYGSGKGGHTVGLGSKGQKVRGRGHIPQGFEGGQVPLFRKIPKLSGFRNPTRKEIVAISVVRLNHFKDGSTVTPADLIKEGILKRVPKHGVKILANGNLYKKLRLSGFLYTKKVGQIIEKSGSEIL